VAKAPMVKGMDIMAGRILKQVKDGKIVYR
jgi:hypothetical protein